MFYSLYYVYTHFWFISITIKTITIKISEFLHKTYSYFDIKFNNIYNILFKIQETDIIRWLIQFAYVLIVVDSNEL